jgi:hypothetical protein
MNAPMMEPMTASQTFASVFGSGAAVMVVAMMAAP